MRVRGEVTGEALARSAAHFPLVGALQGLLAAAGALLLLRAYAPGIVGALVVAFFALLNGGVSPRRPGRHLRRDGRALDGGRRARPGAPPSGHEGQRDRGHRHGGGGAGDLLKALFLGSLLTGALFGSGSGCSS